MPSVTETALLSPAYSLSPVSLSLSLPASPVHSLAMAHTKQLHQLQQDHPYHHEEGKREEEGASSSFSSLTDAAQQATTVASVSSSSSSSFANVLASPPSGVKSKPIFLKLLATTEDEEDLFNSWKARQFFFLILVFDFLPFF